LNRKQKHRLKCYGLIPADFLSLFISQGQGSAICQQSFRSMPKRHLCIDHNHTTGTVRDLPCQGMQSSYRSRKESIQRLQGAIAYLHTEIPMDTSPPNNEEPATGKSRVSSKVNLNNDAEIVLEVPQERKSKVQPEYRNIQGIPEDDYYALQDNVGEALSFINYSGGDSADERLRPSKEKAGMQA
jgi:hypothetical protein